MRVKKMYTYQIKEVTFVNNRRRVVLKYVIAAILVCCLFVTSLIPNLIITCNGKLRQKQPTKFSTDLKYILFWTLKEKKNQIKAGQMTFVKQRCPILNCYVSYNKTFLGKDMTNFDAVVFGTKEITKLNTRQFNFTRSPHQIYILHSLEPASKVPLCNPKLENFFNWTWTYKLNSDIPHPFFNIHNKNRTIIGPRLDTKWSVNLSHDTRNIDIIKKKTRAIAWIVNQCKSKKRNKKFIKEFQAELSLYNYTLDIYGSCGQRSCIGPTRFKCYKMIEKNYFFSLVTEDTSSDDWVTEKVINTLNHVTIPVVIGGANYSSFLPPGSYIDAKTFTMKELVGLINYLMMYPNVYSLFFDWKDHYYFTPRSRSYLCDLCFKLNINNTNKSYKDMRSWWNPDFKSRCETQLMRELFYDSSPDDGNTEN